MPDNYGYINARLRAMHGKLLSSKLEEAISASSYQEFLRVLSESSMGADLGDATAQGAGLPALDRAVSRNFYNTAQKIVGMADGEAGREINALFARYDLGNLKAIARGKLAARSAADIEGSLLPAGTLKPAVLQALAAAPDLASLNGVVGLAGSPLAGAFRKAVAQLIASNDLLAFEVTLDQAYYTEALAQASSDTLRNYLRREVDGANILTALKLKAQGRTLNLDGYFIKGGREVDANRFNQIAQGSGGLEGLRAFAAVTDAPDLGAAESAVRAVILKEAKGLYAADALGPGVVIGFLKEKENEIAVTRLIARGKYYNVPAETLRKEVGRGA